MFFLSKYVYIKQFVSGTEMLFDLEFYGRLIGMFESNNFTIELPNPIVSACKTMKESSKSETYNEYIMSFKPLLLSLQSKMMEEDICEDEGCLSDHEHHEDIEAGSDHEESDNLEDDTFIENCLPQLEGTGLFPLMSYLNHSCEPNAEIRYVDGNSEASVVALRQIKEGEEVLVSYIDEHADYDERCELLASYQFICECSKCVAQE